MAIPCLICGGEIIFDKLTKRTCSLCRRKEENELVCKKGHYVCKKCHTSKRPKSEDGLPL